MAVKHTSDNSSSHALTRPILQPRNKIKIPTILTVKQRLVVSNLTSPIYEIESTSRSTRMYVRIEICREKILSWLPIKKRFGAGACSVSKSGPSPDIFMLSRDGGHMSAFSEGFYLFARKILIRIYERIRNPSQSQSI